MAATAGAEPSVNFGGAGGFGGLGGRLRWAVTLGQATCTSTKSMANPAKQWTPLGTISVVQAMNNQPTSRPPLITTSSSDWKRYTQIPMPTTAGRKMEIEYSAASASRLFTVIDNASLALSTDEVNTNPGSTNCLSTNTLRAATEPNSPNAANNNSQPKICPTVFCQSHRYRPERVPQRTINPPANAASAANKNGKPQPPRFSQANPLESGRGFVGEVFPTTKSSR